MATINYAAREISVKIVYYGPGLSGKTTNLQVIHRKIPVDARSDMVSLATETDRTLFFDFLPLDLGRIRGFTTKFQLYTVPGQVYYNATRKLVLRGVDGIVFVADSAPNKMDENIESFRNMEENLTEYGYKRETIPVVIQYNKRDLPSIVTLNEINSLVNKYNYPWNEAVANRGKGVFESLKLIGKLVIDHLNQKYATSSSQKQYSPATGFHAEKPVQQQRPAQPPQMHQTPSSQQSTFSRPQAPYMNPQTQDPFNQSPPSPMTQHFQTPPPPNKPGASQYGTINLEPMVQESSSTVKDPFASSRSSKSQLELEMETYYSKLMQGPPQQQNIPKNQPIQQPVQPMQPLAYTPPSQQQPQTQFTMPLFDTKYSETQQYRQPPVPPIAQQTPQPPQYSAPQYQPFQYQQSQPVFGDQSNFPNYKSQENQSNAAEGKDDSEFSLEETGGETPMYFTSVNTEMRKKGKKPVNPKHKAKKGIFGKFFNKDSQ